MDWVDKKIEERNEAFLEKGDLTIKMDPEIAKLFYESSSVSSKFV